MRSSDFHEECPNNPSKETCGLAAARWLVENQLIYIDVEPTKKEAGEQKALFDEVPGVFWDDASAGNALRLVDKTSVMETSSTFASATFDCQSCSRWVKVSLEPFDAFGIDVVHP